MSTIKKPSEYRVRKHHDLFYIEVSENVSIKKHLWGTIETKVVWRRCGKDGLPLKVGKFGLLVNPIQAVEDLQTAMDLITILLKPDEIFEYGYTYEGIKNP